MIYGIYNLKGKNKSRGSFYLYKLVRDPNDYIYWSYLGLNKHHRINGYNFRWIKGVIYDLSKKQLINDNPYQPIPFSDDDLTTILKWGDPT